MENIYINAWGNFSQNDFTNKIHEAIVLLSKINNLKIENFKIISHSSNVSFSTNNGSFLGQNIIFEISKEEVSIGQLDCIIDNSYSYIEIT
jgi:hypothetical protein